MPLINYPHLASMAFGVPQYATANVMNAVKALLVPRMMQGGAVLLDGDIPDAPVTPDRQLEAEDESRYQIAGLAIIPVHGVLVSRRGVLTAACTEVNSYERLRANIASALNDQRVKEIVLDINSGGGAATGCKELAEYIFEARQQKPITAIVNFNAYSAAYFIASACSRVVISETGGCGSVGTILEHMEISRYEEQVGIKVTTFYRGDRKKDGSMHEPLSEGATAAIDSMLQQAYDLFVASVAKYRGLSVDVVKATEAGCFTGQTAVNVGFADELISNPQDYINAMATRVNAPQPSLSSAKPKVGLRARVASLK